MAILGSKCTLQCCGDHVDAEVDPVDEGAILGSHVEVAAADAAAHVEDALVRLQRQQLHKLLQQRPGVRAPWSGMHGHSADQMDHKTRWQCHALHSLQYSQDKIQVPVLLP